ncbi:hypothetical protein TRFO_34918 [Tritrichomonas foetus]|uniref:Uncharacterized protein n=1 Tax=Tritrichomonas foetus TaxID=1144522 RepID=A0A1J4JHL5_9EUKA|nr:hypothetical protein TRFO_34918 [Tritrichomonas foetus]|eukprot:OHS98640.1 hypothetical protein TRFO_34918 [Tritrichomonas foetus]
MDERKEAFPDNVFLRGNVTLGNAMRVQIELEEKLNQLRLNNFKMLNELEKRSAECRKKEEIVDIQEKNVKQAIADFRAITQLKLLSIQEEQSNLELTNEAIGNTMKKIVQVVKENAEKIEEEKEKIEELVKFEMTAAQYKDVLETQKKEMNDNIESQIDNQIHTKITWYRNEIENLENQITGIKNRLKVYEDKLNALSRKNEQNMHQINEFNNERQDQHDPNSYDRNREKVVRLQRKTHKIFSIVNNLHQLQTELVSRISTLSARYVKYDVLLQKYNTYLLNIRSNNIESYNLLLSEDDKEKTYELKRFMHKKIRNMNQGISSQTISLQKKINYIVNTKNSHLKDIEDLKQQINEYPRQKQGLKQQKTELDEESQKLDIKYEKMQVKINQINTVLTVASPKKKSKKKLPDFIEHPIKHPQYEQIKYEDELIRKIIQYKEKIIELNVQINQYENDNKELKKRIDRNSNRLISVQNKMKKLWNYTRKNYNHIDIDMTPINRLHVLIDRNVAQISHKSQNITKKRKRIQDKVSLYNNIKGGLGYNFTKKRSYHDNYPIPKQTFDDLEYWIISIEREIMRWEGMHFDESKKYFLQQWNDKFPSILNEAYSSYSYTSSSSNS